jgi:predicted porin
MRFRPHVSATLVLAACLGLSRSATGIDLSASAIVYWTAVDTLTSESDNTEQRYSLRLRQELTPFLSLQAAYRYYDYTAQFTGLPEASRTRQTPSFQLLYNRPRLTANLGAERRTSEGTFDSEDFQADAVYSGFSWRATKGLTLSGQARNSTNEADVSALGRDIDQQTYVFDANYRRARWNLGYSFNRNDLENRSTGFDSLQDVHRLRLAGSHDFFDRRLSLGVSGSVGRIETQSQNAGDDDFAEPVPAVQGLYAIDTAPEVGELDPAPGLVDGDFFTPSPPIIDIGGGNAFRNLGVDLGAILPVSRLEVAVDRPSGPAVVWQVFHSADNLIWEPITGQSAEFDAGRQLYRVRFPETDDRFFKVVNVSPNAAPLVLVTEVTAYRAVAEVPEATDQQGTLYRGDVSLGFRPTRRVSARVNLGGSNDETVTAGIVRRDYTERHAAGTLAVRLTNELEISGGYRYSDSENRGPGELFRTTETVDAALRWAPMPTLDAILSASRRDESERETLLQTIDLLQLTVFTALLPDLDLTSRLSYSELTDPITGQDRNTWSWREDLRSRPTQRWTLDGSIGYSLTETPLNDRLLERQYWSLRSAWSPGAHLFLDGALYWSRDNELTSTSQVFGLSYIPGPKLIVNLSHRETSTDTGRKTSGDSLSANYRLHPRVQLSGSWNRSKVSLSGDLTSQTDSLLVGFSIFFY